MKRFGALAIALCLLLAAVYAAHAAESILSDAEGLAAHRSELDKIRENLAYAETAGYRALNVKLSAVEGDGGTVEQVTQAGDIITISGGLHYIEAPTVIDVLVLENDAVLLNFDATVNNINITGTSQYYSIGKNGAKNITLTDISLAYLQDTVGETIVAGGQSEVLLLGSISYDTLYTMDMASLAVLGNVNITAADQQSTGRIFDPNQMLPVHTPEGTPKAGGVGGSGRGGSGGKSSAPKEEGPYPDYLIEWVFGSTPSNPGGPAEWKPIENCGCCNCGKVCNVPQQRCCSDCKCSTWTLTFPK